MSFKSRLMLSFPSTPTCSRLSLSARLSDHACLTPPYNAVRLGTASLLSVPVRLRHLQYFCHSLYYHPTSTTTYVTGSRYKCPPLNFPSPQLPIWPPTRISRHQHLPHPLFISIYLSLSLHSATYPALQSTLSSPHTSPSTVTNSRVFHAGGFCFLKRPGSGGWKVISSCDLWRDLEEFETWTTADRNFDHQ